MLSITLFLATSLESPVITLNHSEGHHWVTVAGVSIFCATADSADNLATALRACCRNQESLGACK
jgi:hypothetical protein